MACGLTESAKALGAKGGRASKGGAKKQARNKLSNRHTPDLKAKRMAARARARDRKNGLSSYGKNSQVKDDRPTERKRSKKTK